MTATNGQAPAPGVIPISLSWNEIVMAAQVGVTRHVQGLYAGGERSSWQWAIEGSCAEMAVGRYLGLYWSGALDGYDHNGVVAIRVRVQPSHRFGELMLRPGDRPDAAFVLVTGRAPDYHLVGWLTGADGLRREYWSDNAVNRDRDPGAFQVPQLALKPMKDLFSVVHGTEPTMIPTGA